jgi:tape measure domain-containing protein
MAKLSGNPSGMVGAFRTAASAAEGYRDRVRQATANAVDSSAVSAKASEAGKRAGGGFSSAFKGAVSGLGLIVAAAGLTSLIGDAMAASDATDKFKATMNFAGLDTSKIDAAAKTAKNYADQTVYDLPTIQNTIAQLASNGIKDYTGLTQAAGNLNAVAGGNAQTFGSVAMMLTQTAGAGKLSTENWNQLADAIPGAAGPLMKALEQAGAYTGNFRTAMEKGQITSDEFNAALMTLGNKPVAVEAAKSTVTFEGALGGLAATVNSKLMTALDAIKPVATTAITFLTTGLAGAFDFVAGAVGNVASWVGTDLVPAFQNMLTWGQQNMGMLTTIATVIGVILLPALIRVGVAATVSAAQQVIAWITSGAGAVTTGVKYVATSWLIVGSWVRQGAAAIASGATTVAIWALYAAEAIKGAAQFALQVLRIVAGWVLMGVQSMIQAARMAAAWFIALGPIGWVIAIVIGLVALIIANWDAVSSWTAQAWSNIVAFVVDAWNNMVTWVTGAVTAVVTPIVDGFNAMLAFITGIFTAIGSFITGVWTWIFNLLTAIGQAFWAEHGAQLTAAWNFIVAIFTGVFNFYVSIWTAIITFIVQAVTNIVNGIVAGFTAAWNFIVAVSTAIWTAIVTAFTAAWTFIVSIFTTISAFIGGVWAAIYAAISAALAAVWGVIVSVFSTVWGFISGIFNTIRGFIAGVWGTIVGVIAGAVGAVSGLIRGWVSMAWAVISSTFNSVVGFLGGIWGSIINGVSGMVGRVGGFFSGLWGTITGALSGAGQWLWSAGVNIVQGLINGVQSLAGSIGSAFLNMIPGWIVGPFKAAMGIASPSKLFKTFGRFIIQGLGIGIDSEKSTAVKAISGAAAAVERAGSGITLTAPKFAMPKAPKLNTDGLTVDPITIKVSLDSSAFDAAANKLTLGDMSARLGGSSAGSGAMAGQSGAGKSREAVPAAQQVFNITNYNPVAEPTSKTVEKAQNVAALSGVF